MTKVLYNNEYIELHDELEHGYMELDTLNDNIQTENNLDDTMEIKPINIEDTLELKVEDLEDTLELELSDINDY